MMLSFPILTKFVFGSNSGRLPVGLLIFVAFVSGQIEFATAQVDWKQAQIAELENRLSQTTDTFACAEIVSQKQWLQSWQPGQMNTRPRTNNKLPEKRLEPRLESERVKDIESTMEQVDPEPKLDAIRELADRHPDDAAVIQTYLRRLDDAPSIRKQHLDEIEKLATTLIDLLDQLDASDTSNTERKLARQYARYRRVRALAYRELPDVVAMNPIENQAKLDEMISRAFKQLVDDAGRGKTEFILIEIRMLRRSGRFATALMQLEKYGSTLSPKWYLKKRRDLLGELDWELAYDEAAQIYAEAFPEEVAKEMSRAVQNKSLRK